MQNEILEMVTKFNENVFASAKAIGELNLRTFEQLAAKQAEVINDCLESSAKQYREGLQRRCCGAGRTAQGLQREVFGQRARDDRNDELAAR